ncbi:Hypothetical protein A7982_07955 [Minicystis rosea]|nr:Hypothetical protein A7982_07955 [Minicystis rosea]
MPDVRPRGFRSSSSSWQELVTPAVAAPAVAPRASIPVWLFLVVVLAVALVVVGAAVVIMRRAMV